MKICGVILLLCLLFAGGFLVYRSVQNRSDMAVLDEQPETPAEIEGVRWNGGIYQYNEHLSNYLFLGIDKDELNDSSAGMLKAGACDAIFLVSYDRVTKAVTVISIPRDTLTEIEVFLPDGSSAGKMKDHISLSYGYGDGRHESCYLTRDAVSNLFYGLTINGYCAMSMDGLVQIPETIGSFEVVVPNDSLAAAYPEYQKGSTVEITAENVETFVRYRDITAAHSALARQERQTAFLEAALSCIESQFQQDAGIVTELYDDLSDYMVTNMSNDLFVDLLEAVYTQSEVRSLSLPGEAVEGSAYDEFHVAEDELYEMIIQEFYVNAEG